ncbi:MAG: transglutaminase domain-containing protein, partial [Phycisphaerales bacterium]
MSDSHTRIDTDGDGLSDFQEVHKYLTDPTKRDSDGDGTPDGDWAERREYTYSVRTVFRFLPPLDEKALNDDFQDARVLEQTDDYVEIEVVHYPLATVYESIGENRNWRRDYAHLTEYLAPGATTNWDAPMRQVLLAELKGDGIDVEALSDKQVVEQVSRWLLKKSRSLDKVFTTFYVHCPNGRAEVFPGLEDAFRGEFERDEENYDWAIEEHFDHEVLGKGMFYNKTHGSCTSTAVYLTTVLRALGIPTRMVLVSPAVDASDREQILMVKNSITHNQVRETMLAGLRRSSHGFTNHTLNEAYIDNRWVRLDYSTLAPPIFGADRFGLQTHLYTINDLSDIDLAATWGVRYAKGLRSESFQHSNPYSAVEISDLFGAHSNVPNPPFTVQDLGTSPKPDIFIFSPGKVSVWEELLEIVKETTFNKTGRPHEREFYDNVFEGVWQTKPGDILMLLFALDTEERVPEGYEDLLPEPWPQIESRLKQGQTVELAGEARDMKIILLATPRAAQLTSFVQNSALLAALGPSEDAKAARATEERPGWLVEFANGVKVRLLGVCTHPSAGQPWWGPDGTPLETAPYETTGSRMEQEQRRIYYEFAAEVRGSDDLSIRWKVPGSTRSSGTGRAVGPNGRRLAHTYAYTANQPSDVKAANVFLGIATGDWETRAVHKTLDDEGSYTLKNDRAVAFGAAYEKNGDAHVPVTTNIQSTVLNRRLVAIDIEGKSHRGGSYSSGGNVLHSSTYAFDIALSRVKEFRFETRPYIWVEFRNVSLRRGQDADLQVHFAATYNPDVVNKVTLPDVDREAVMLDLASGELVGLPRDASETNVRRTILELGRGDLVFDTRSLILVRDATSLASERMIGEPFSRCPIGQRLPQVLTVTTAEGSRYEITILAANDEGCTLKYALLSEEKDARGVPVASSRQRSSAPESAWLPPSSTVARRMESAAILSELGKCLAIYANDHEGAYPSDLARLPFQRMETEQIQWLLANVAYLGRGKTVHDAPDLVLAYDKVLLADGDGTNVLHNSYRVAFKTAAELQALGTLPLRNRVELLNGVTVEFLAYSWLSPVGGLIWYDPQGQETTIPGVYEADVEGLGTVMAFRVEPPETRLVAQVFRGPDSQNIAKPWQLPENNLWLLPLGEERRFANLRIITELTMPPAIERIPLTDDNLGQLVEVNRCGIARIVDLHVIDETTSEMMMGEMAREMGLPPELGADGEMAK